MEELLAKYILNDGEIHSLKIEADYTSASSSSFRQASVEILIRKKAAKGKWNVCRLHIQLMEIQRLAINEDFTSCYYTDIIFKRVADDMWYLSLDPFGNSGEPHEKDNLVIVANSVQITEVT